MIRAAAARAAVFLPFRQKLWLFDILLESFSPEDHEQLPRSRQLLLHEETSLRRLARLGFTPARVIDVGAYEGEWTQMVKALWPGARVLMIEPQANKHPFLEQTRTCFAGVEYVQTLLGTEAAPRVSFFEMASGSSIYAEDSSVARQVREHVFETLDAVAAQHATATPDLIKVDLQGAELDVLRGGPACLAAAQVLQLELQILPINRGRRSLPTRSRSCAPGTR